MNITIENILLIGSALLFVSIMAGKTSYRIGIPTLLLFLTVGMLAGSEGIGGIYFDNPKTAQFIGIVALNFILFSGGMDTSWTSVKPVLKEGIMLSTVGVLITALGLGTFVWFVSDFSIYESMLLGSIVSSTDAAAVFSILRGKNLALKKNIRPTLELESGSNDPMAYVLTISFLTLVVNQDKEFWSIILIFFQQMILGAIAGLAFGYVSKWIINRIKLDFDGLYPVLVIALMFIAFSFTDFIGGNGFLAIYISSVFLGNQNLIHKKTIMRMFDGMAWLMEIVLFLTLGLLVFPSQMLPFIGIGLLVSLFLIFIARPLAVFIALSVFKMKMRRRVFISWVGLRGAVPIVFATYPLLAGIDKANSIFNIVFFISVSSVLIQGTTLTLMAKWLHVGLPKAIKPRSATDKLLHDYPKSTMELIIIKKGSNAIGSKIVDIDLPSTANIALIERDSKYITPSGSTKIDLLDKLYVLTDKPENLDEVYKALHLSKD